MNLPGRSNGPSLLQLSRRRYGDLDGYQLLLNLPKATPPELLSNHAYTISPLSFNSTPLNLHPSSPQHLT